MEQSPAGSYGRARWISQKTTGGGREKLQDGEEEDQGDRDDREEETTAVFLGMGEFLLEIFAVWLWVAAMWDWSGYVVVLLVLDCPKSRIKLSHSYVLLETCANGH